MPYDSRRKDHIQQSGSFKVRKVSGETVSWWRKNHPYFLGGVLIAWALLVLFLPFSESEAGANPGPDPIIRATDSGGRGEVEAREGRGDGAHRYLALRVQSSGRPGETSSPEAVQRSGSQPTSKPVPRATAKAPGQHGPVPTKAPTKSKPVKPAHGLTKQVLQDAAKKIDAPKPEPKGKVDVPNGALKDPLPLPTGEMCERKPTIVKGKIIDQWKVDTSKRLWAEMVKRGWNQSDRVRALMTFIMEGDFDPKARGDHDNGGSGGMCGLHFVWQKKFLIAEGVMTKQGKLLPKFDDVSWQIGACLDKYAGGTKFYGYRDALHVADKSNGKRIVPGKLTKAKRLIPRITCK